MQIIKMNFVHNFYSPTIMGKIAIQKINEVPEKKKMCFFNKLGEGSLLGKRIVTLF